MVGYVKVVTPRPKRRGQEQGQTMRKNLENRLIAAVWAASFGLTACTIVQATDDGGSAGPSSTGSAGSATAGSSAGSAGTSSTAGAAGQGGGTGGTAGTSDALGDASLPSYKDGSSASPDAGCINDSTDAGDTANPDLCSTLNSTKGGAQCNYNDNEGTQLCSLMHDNARPGAFQVFFDCINAQTKTDACADVNICLDENHWPTGCQVGKVVVSNGNQWDCTNLVAKCPADGAGNGFTLPQCDFIMNVFTDEARTKIFNCYLIKNNDPATCSDDFNNCVFNPDQL